MKMPKYIKGYDGIRGLLAFSVALSHILGHLTGWSSNIYLFNNVSFAVDVFFIMSGIVILFSYQEKIESKIITGTDFIILRFFRLIPLHITMSVLVLISLSVSINNPLPNWLNYNVKLDFIPDLFLLNSLGFYFHSFLNHPAWSISIELWLGCFMFLSFVKSKKSIFLFLTVGFLGILFLT